MKTKLAQFVFYFNSIDRRYFQLAYFVFMMAMFVVQGCPEDGSGGTR